VTLPLNGLVDLPLLLMLQTAMMHGDPIEDWSSRKMTQPAYEAQ